MFEVVLVNFNIKTFHDTFEDAKAYAERACFESLVYCPGGTIHLFSPISGWRIV